jgi:ribosome-binding factor A
MDKLRKIESDLKREISFIINSKIKDPRVGFVTITGVKLSPDYHYLDVFISVMGEEKNIDDSIAGLKNCDGFIKKNIKQRFKIKYIPDLRFIYDASIQTGLRVSELLDDLKVNDEEK